MMVEKYKIRTDLAMEQKERFESDHVEVSGVVLEEEYDEEKEIKITTVRIETENGAKAMGKPVGTYLTLEAPNMAAADEGYHREISETLAGFLEKYMKDTEENQEKGYSVLVVGLGNREVTPDALGPYVVDQLNVTRHVETVVLLSQQKPDDTIEIDLDLDELDATSAELKATYQEIKDYVLKEFGLKVSNLYISQVKRKCGIEVGENYNLPKSENARVPQCPKEKEDAIKAALKYYAMI